MRKDYLDRITEVQIGSMSFSVETIARWIDKDHEYVYTIKYGQEAKVHARIRRDTNRIFLTTEPDSTLENNLDFLPSF